MNRLLALFVALMAFVGLALGAVNVNTATQAELEALHGIGPVKAKAIIDYRAKHGPFKSLEELDNVPGIGKATLEKMRPDVTFSGATTGVAKEKAAASAKEKPMPSAAEEMKAESKPATSAKGEIKRAPEAAREEAKTEGKAETKAPAKKEAKPTAAEKKKEAAAKKKEAAAAKKKEPANKEASKPAGELDINSASAKELAKLPGIGDTRAKAIVKGRPYHGKDDLVQKKILSESVYDGIKDLVVAKQKKK